MSNQSSFSSSKKSSSSSEKPDYLGNPNAGFWCVIDLLAFITDILAITFYASRELTASEVLNRFHLDEGRRFANFARSSLMSGYLVRCLAFACFWAVLYILKLLRFNQKIGLLSLVFKMAGEQAGGMGAAFLIVMTGHAWILHMVFYTNYENYRSMASTFFGMFMFMLGDEQYEDIMTTSNYTSDAIGKVTLFTFSIMMVIFILNFVIAVINSAQMVSTEKNFEVNGEDYELAQFMLSKVTDLFEGSAQLPPKYLEILKAKRDAKLQKSGAVGPELEEKVDAMDQRLNVLLSSVLYEDDAVENLEMQ